MTKPLEKIFELKEENKFDEVFELYIRKENQIMKFGKIFIFSCGQKLRMHQLNLMKELK